MRSRFPRPLSKEVQRRRPKQILLPTEQLSKAKCPRLVAASMRGDQLQGCGSRLWEVRAVMSVSMATVGISYAVLWDRNIDNN